VQISLVHWSMAELDEAYDHLTGATRTARALGRYALGATLLSARGEIWQEISRRQAESVTYTPRQLSMVPPTTYDRP